MGRPGVLPSVTLPISSNLLFHCSEPMVVFVTSPTVLRSSDVVIPGPPFSVDFVIFGSAPSYEVNSLLRKTSLMDVALPCPDICVSGRPATSNVVRVARSPAAEPVGRPAPSHATVVVRPPPEVNDCARPLVEKPAAEEADRKSTRLNSSHSQISYAVFC